MILTVYDHKKEREVKVGELHGDIFVKKVNRKKHFCWKHRGWGIDSNVISQLKEKKIIAIIFDEGNKRFGSPLSDFLKNAIKDNLGHGEQYFIPETKLDKLES